MAKRKVIVKNKTLLELLEPAETGDIIDLQEVSLVDSSFVDLLIDSEKEKAVAARIEEAKKRFKAESDIEISRLNSQIENLKTEQDNKIIIKEQEVSKKYSEQISELKAQKQTEIDGLKHKIDFLTEQNNKNLEIKERDVAKQFSDRIAELNQQIESLKSSKEFEIKQLKAQNELDKSKLLSDEKDKLTKKEDELNKIILELRNEIELLKGTQKSEIEKIHSQNEAEKSQIQKSESEKYSQLQSQFNVLQASFEDKVNQAKNEIVRDYENRISSINSQNQLALAGKDAQIQTKEYEFAIEKNKVLQEQKDMYEQALREKEEVINNLQRAKAATIL